MTRLVVTADAEADLSEILDYLKEQASALVAEDYGRKIPGFHRAPGRVSRHRLSAQGPRARHPNWRRAAVHPDLRLYGRRRQAHSASHRAQQTQYHAPIGPRRLARNRCSISSREAVSRRQLHGFLEIVARRLDAVALAGDVQLRTKRDKAVIFGLDDCSELSDHGSGPRIGMAYCNSTIHRPEATELATVHLFLQEAIAHRPAADALGGGQDGVHVEAVVAVELGDGARLAEVLDAQRAHAVAAHAAEPR